MYSSLIMRFKHNEITTSLRVVHYDSKSLTIFKSFYFIIIIIINF